MPTGISTTVANISKAGADVCAALVTKYLAALPVDPLTNNGTPVTDCTSSYDTNYTVVKSAADNRITVAAPAAELGATITVTR